MHLTLDNKVLLVSIFLLALIARVVALFFVEPISNPSTWEYEKIANNLLQGKGLFWTFYGTPYRATYIVLYPLLCAGVYFFTSHSFLALKLLQIFISLLTCLLIYRIALKLFTQGTAILALFLVGLHPGLVYYSVRLHSLTLDAFMFTLSVFLFLKILEGRRILRFSIFTGIIFGLAMFSRSTIGLFLPFALLLVFLKFRKNISLVSKATFLVILCMSLTLLPWWVRNYIIFNKPVVTPTESGLTFWLGYNKYATGTNKTLEGKFLFDVAPREFRETVLSMDEFGQKEYFYSKGMDFIKKYPLRSFGLFLKKIKYFWWFTPTQGQEYPKVYLAAYKIYWILILPLFCFGLYQKIREGPASLRHNYDVLLIVIFLLTMTLVHACFNLDGRHRWGIESFVLIFAANGINYFFTRLKKEIK